MTKENLIKKVSAFIKKKPQSITLNIKQLEKLADLEVGAFILWEDIKQFNDEIGNNHLDRDENKDEGNK